MIKTLTLAAVTSWAAAHDVHTLDHTNFDTLVHLDGKNLGHNELGWFVKFYAPWCGKSKKMAQSWTDFALKYDEVDIHVGEMDCDTEENAAICERFKVKAYPTLIWFPMHEGFQNEWHRYNGPRAWKAYHEFTLNKAYQPTDENITEHLQPDHH